MQLQLLQKQAVDVKAAVKNKLGVIAAPAWAVSGVVELLVAEDKFSGSLASGEAVGAGQLVLSYGDLAPLVIDVEVLPAPAQLIEAEIGEPRDI